MKWRLSLVRSLARKKLDLLCFLSPDVKIIVFFFFFLFFFFFFFFLRSSFFLSSFLSLSFISFFPLFSLFIPISFFFLFLYCFFFFLRFSPCFSEQSVNYDIWKLDNSNEVSSFFLALKKEMSLDVIFYFFLRSRNFSTCLGFVVSFALFFIFPFSFFLFLSSLCFSLSFIFSPSLFICLKRKRGEVILLLHGRENLNTESKFVCHFFPIFPFS